jgi:hypothetical protein
MKVSWDDDSQYIMENKIHVPNHQIINLMDWLRKPTGNTIVCFPFLGGLKPVNVPLTKPLN